MPRAGVELFPAVGAMGVVDACNARSRTTSRRMDGNKGWLLASGDGGAVTWMTVLNARRNCLADRFSGKTYHSKYVVPSTRRNMLTAKRLSI